MGTLTDLQHRTLVALAKLTHPVSSQTLAAEMCSEDDFIASSDARRAARQLFRLGLVDGSPTDRRSTWKITERGRALALAST